MSLKHGMQFGRVRFSRDSKQLLITDRDVAQVWDMRNGGLISGPLKRSGEVFAEFSPDGDWLVSISTNNSVRVWDVRTGQPVTTSRGHTDLVSSVAFSPDGQHVLSGSYDGRLPT